MDNLEVIVQLNWEEIQHMSRQMTSNEIELVIKKKKKKKKKLPRSSCHGSVINEPN